MHRHPNGGLVVLNGDFGLSLADVIDDATRSRLDTEFVAVGKLPQLANAYE
jgi:hypothetical protein